MNSSAESSITTPTMPLSSDPETNTIMLELEKKAEIQLAQLMSPVKNTAPLTKIAFVGTQGEDFGQKLISLMANGAKEFQEKTGRPMTYSEMREMYG